ncbi:MAG: hypothetical protein Q9220_003733 [cf. Caloplaca sp. 1 TL-2023]
MSDDSEDYEWHQPLDRTSSGSIIVYDPTEQRISLHKRKDLDKQTPIITLRAPRVGNHMNIYAKRDDSDMDRLVAMLNLGVLGWSATIKRAMGKINEVWVMELPKDNRRVRVALGKIVGKGREKHSKLKARLTKDRPVSQEKDNISKVSASVGSTAKEQAEDNYVPGWLRPCNKTLETITKHTEKYLQGEDVQKEIRGCAEELVKGRRARARQDPQRWEKVCFTAWYQCVEHDCPRGENEYPDRKKMRTHLLDKHGDVYQRGEEESMEKLEKALDDYKIIVR